MPVAEGGTMGRLGGARLKVATACCATVLVVWACFLTILSYRHGVALLELAVVGVAPAYLLTRLGRRWSPVDSSLLACLLAFMAWGGGLHFQPFPHALRLPGAGYLSPTSERIIYGIYAIFFVALGIEAFRLTALTTKAPETATPLQSSWMAISFPAGVLFINIWVGTFLARGVSPSLFIWRPTGILLMLMLGMIPVLLAISLASSLGYIGHRPGESRRLRPKWIVSWIMLMGLLGAATSARSVLREPIPAYLLPNYNAHGASYKNPFPEHRNSGEPTAPSNAGGDGQPALNQP